MWAIDHAVFPEAGGLLDQDARFLDIVETLRAEIIRSDDERARSNG